MTILAKTKPCVNVDTVIKPIDFPALRIAIYKQFPELFGNVQIIRHDKGLRVAGIRGYTIEPATADRLGAFLVSWRPTGTAPMNEADFMAYTLCQLRSGDTEPIARLTDAQMVLIERERPGEEISLYPWAW